MSTSTTETAASPAVVVATVGAFKLFADGSIVGPAEYLASEHYRACIAKIRGGQSAIVNYGGGSGQRVETLILVALQTDYASWKGLQSLGIGRRSWERPRA